MERKEMKMEEDLLLLETKTFKTLISIWLTHDINTYIIYTI